MATITTYATLVSALQEVSENDATEFVSYIPTAIDLAEERLLRELELPELQIKSTGTLSSGTATLNKPTRYRLPHYFKITVSSNSVLLHYRKDDFIMDYWPNTATTGVPKYYGDYSETQLIIAPTPDSNYAYEIKFTQQPQKLSSSNSTNYFVTNCQDILFAACMIECARFMKAWSQVNIWEAAFVAARDSWNIEASRQRRDDGSVPNNPEGGPNSLKHTIKSNS